MFRPALLSLAFLSTPAFAAGYFDAQPLTRPAQERFVARDNAWRCNEAGCSSARTATRPALVCAGLVRAVGPLRSFTVDGRAFTAAELEACNGRAR
ncbi:MAG: hypothetical protein QOG13_2433 [Sphingomonadales bacterium]|jgi:hypothetical protein|nr:hypothetical protein [Sphingomonadales bacterium]MEA3043498.1 hypothetical protein [Sphingomonadales bacterium]